MNTQTLEDRMMLMKPQELQQFAAMHKNDPYVLPLAMKISDMRKKMTVAEGLKYAGQKPPTVAEQAIAGMAPRQLPEEQGIGPLAAPNIQGMADGGIAGYAGGGKSFDVDAYLNNPNVEKYLAYINAYEGRPKENQMVNYKPFDDLSDHPRTKVKFGRSKNQVSSAAGAYQLLEKSWDDQKKKLGLSDFSLENQKRAAIGLLKEQGALKDVVKGDFAKANQKAKNIWASLPGSTIGEATGQHARVRPDLEAALHNKKPVVAEQKLGLPREYADFFNRFMPGTEAHAGELQMSRPPVSNGTAGIAQLPTIPEANRGNTLTGKVNGPAATRVPAPAAAPAPYVSQADLIPTPNAKYQATPPRPEPENKLLRAGKDVLGAPEALAAALTGAVAPATHLVPMGLAALEGTPISREEAVNAVTFAPRSEVGQGSLENLNQAFEDFKIPPFIPAIGGARAPRVGAAMEAEAAAARAAAEAAKGKVENVRLPPPVPEARPAAPSRAAERPTAPSFPLQDATLEMQRQAQLARERQALNNLAKDRNEAKVAETKATGLEKGAESGRMLDEIMKARELENAKRNAFSRNLGKASAATNIATQATAPAAAPQRPYEAWEQGFTAPETNYQAPSTAEPFAPPSPAAAQAGAAAQAPAAKQGFNMSDEDWLNLGLGLLKSGPRQGNAIQDLLSNTGRAGAEALASRKEREKAAQEADYKKAMMQYYKDTVAAQNRPGETERMVERIAKEQGIPFSEAFGQFKTMAYGAGQLSPALLLKEYEKNSKDMMNGDVFKAQYPTFESYMQARQAAVSGGAVDSAQIDPNVANQFRIVGSRPTQ